VRTALDMIHSWGAACLAAFQFLSRLPVPVTLDYGDVLFRRSTVFYPLVGAVLGFLLAGAAWGLHELSISPQLAAVLLLTLWVALTGALHLDGLMDTADGVLSGRNRERMLEIMKDSRVGAMGVVVCVLQLLLKWVLLTEVMISGSTTKLLLLAVVLLWSRWYMVAAIVCWPYARAQGSGGLGGMFGGIGRTHLVWSLAMALVLTCGVMQLALDWSFPKLAMAFMWFAVTVVAGGLMSLYLSRKLGGLTGDTYGAMNELLETLLLFVMISWIG
jgi:adenosylcobinamide-GDP ribazoletransferase